MAGEYRTEAVLMRLPKDMADAIRGGLRIGLSCGPMTGVVLKPELAADMAKAYAAIGESRYAEGLSSGEMVPLVPSEGPDRYWAPGELFFRS